MHLQLMLLCLCVALGPVAAAPGFKTRRPQTERINESYLDPDQPELSQQKLLVKSLTGANDNVESYSGYIRVNSTTNSSLFFWFFPSAATNKSAPLLLWLQGGPGSSSLFGLFNEHGPWAVDQGLNLKPRPYAWNTLYSMLYIDSPVGTGFSFTDSEAGYTTNVQEVTRDLMLALEQFFRVFAQYQKVDFYLTGQSYAGKVVPSLAREIHLKNQENGTKINMKGIAIGNGFCDPINMLGYGTVFYNIGLISKEQKLYFDSEENTIRNFIKSKQPVKAFETYDELITGERTPYPSYLKNVTGLSNYMNYLLMSDPDDFTYYVKFLKNPQIREALHVGTKNFNTDAKTVQDHLLADITVSAVSFLEEILDWNYKVLLYSGQVDMILPYQLTLNFIDKMNWTKKEEFLKSPRGVWRVNTSPLPQVAGYATEASNFAVVLVRNAGHIVPYDQPLFAFDLISRFIENKPIADPRDQ